MSWLLKHRKKDNKYRIYTTISDGWITDWLTESEMKEHLIWEQAFRNKEKAIEIMMTFPEGWYNYDSDNNKVGYQLLTTSTKGKIAFTEWKLEALKSGNYESEVEKKYINLLTPTDKGRDDI